MGTQKLTEKQSRLVRLVQKNPGKSTHQLAVLRSDYQVYETSLRDRLWRLMNRGVLRVDEILAKNNPDQLVARHWYYAGTKT